MKSIWTALFVLLFLQAGSVANTSPTAPLNNAAATQRAPLEARGDLIQRRSAEEAKALADEKAREDSARRSKDEADKLTLWFTGVTAVATGVLALIALGQALLFLWQLKLMRESAVDAAKAANASASAAQAAAESNDLAQKTFVADQRPWVTVSLEPAGPLKLFDNNQLQVSYKITVRNIGKSPAVKVHHEVNVTLTFDEATRARDIQRDLHRPVQWMGEEPGWNLLPGEERSVIVHRCPGNMATKGPDDIDALLIGTVHYRPAFDEALQYHTGFIYEVGYWDTGRKLLVRALNLARDGGEIPATLVRFIRSISDDGEVV